MSRIWIYLSVFFCSFCGVFNDAEHAGEVQTLMIPDYMQCLKKDGYVLENVIRTHDTCVQTQIAELWRTYGANNFQQMKRLICQENAFTDCFDSANKKLANCFEFDRKNEAFVDAFTSINAVISFVCGNNQAELMRIMQEPFRQCLKSKENRISECSTVSKNINDVWFQKSYRMEPFCDLRGNWGTCVVDRLDECEDKTAMEVTKAVFTVALMASPCKEKIEEDHSELASSMTIVLNNYLLLVPLVFTFAAIFLT